MKGAASRLASSYRVRLTLGVLLTVAVVAGAWTWSLYGPLTDAVIRQQQDHLVAVAQAGVLVLGETEQTAPDVLRRLVARTDLRATIVAADGTVLADSESDPDAMGNHGQRPEIVEALAGRVGIERRVSETQNLEQIYVAVPASFDGMRVALRVSEPLDEIEALAARSRRAALLLLTAAILAAGLLAVRIAAIAAAPVERLSSAAQQMAGGDLRAAVPQEQGELAKLSDALTDLREQIRVRIDELSTEKHNLRSVLDGLTDAVFLLHDDRIVFANSAAGVLFRAPALGWVDRRPSETELPASVTAAIEARIPAAENTVVEVGPGPDWPHLAHGGIAAQSHRPLRSHPRRRQRYYRAHAGGARAPGFRR
jgi:HAMP domain-containing protein